MTGGFSRRGFSARGLFISIFTAARALASAALLRVLATRRCLAPLLGPLLGPLLSPLLSPLLAPLLALTMLPACSLLPQQTPVPIVEHSFQPPAPTEETTEAEEPSTVAAAEPASEPKTPRPAKPKRRVVKPKPAAPPAPPPAEEPEPPPPPQIISTRILQHDQLHGLLDSEVQRPDGKVIGRAVDMYIDAAAKPKVMMVNLAGFLGVGDRKVICPWSAFRFTPAAKTPAITLGASAAPAAGKAKADAAPPKPQPVKDVPPNLMQLVDSTVLQKNGARMGRVVDVLIDSQAEPQAVVVDLSDSLSGDKRHVAASWGDLHVLTRNKTPTLQMDFTDAQLKASPTYGPDQPIKIVSPVVPAPASAPASTAAAASAASAPTSSGPVATGSVASGAGASGARASR